MASFFGNLLGGIRKIGNQLMTPQSSGFSLARDVPRPNPNVGSNTRRRPVTPTVITSNPMAQRPRTSTVTKPKTVSSNTTVTPTTSTVGAGVTTPNFRDIPTFGAEYFMPTNTLNLMNQLMSAKPSYNEGQLQQRAEAQTELLTNPQIEALREQINAFKTLIPETREGLEGTYADSQSQLQDSQSELFRALLNEAETSGGMRAGTAHALQSELSNEASPLWDSLRTDYQNTRDSVMGALESQKREAREMLSSIQSNRANITQDNYNALKDQAIAQFRDAQQVQQKFLQSMVDMESGARDASATFQQEAAAAYNNFQAQQSQILNALYEQQQQQQRETQFQLDLDNWINVVTGPGIKTKNQAMGMLQRHQDDILQSIGQEGYEAIQQQILNLQGNWSNPNYQYPESEMHNYGQTSTTNQMDRNRFLQALVRPSTSMDRFYRTMNTVMK